VNFATSCYKAFALGERANLESRFELFNTFSQTGWKGVSTGCNSGNFGQTSDSRDRPIGRAASASNPSGFQLRRGVLCLTHLFLWPVALRSPPERQWNEGEAVCV
jgi:hypothetical protein